VDNKLDEFLEEMAGAGVCCERWSGVDGNVVWVYWKNGDISTFEYHPGRTDLKRVRRAILERDS